MDRKTWLLLSAMVAFAGCSDEEPEPKLEPKPIKPNIEYTVTSDAVKLSELETSVSEPNLLRIDIPIPYQEISPIDQFSELGANINDPNLFELFSRKRFYTQVTKMANGSIVFLNGLLQDAGAVNKELSLECLNELADKFIEKYSENELSRIISTNSRYNEFKGASGDPRHRTIGKAERKFIAAVLGIGIDPKDRDNYISLGFAINYRNNQIFKEKHRHLRYDKKKKIHSEYTQSEAMAAGVLPFAGNISKSDLIYTIEKVALAMYKTPEVNPGPNPGHLNFQDNIRKVPVGPNTQGNTRKALGYDGNRVKSSGNRVKRGGNRR